MLESKHILSIIKQCHVFVCSGFGEAWCIPAMEAMALGLPVIYPANSGLGDFAHGWEVKTSEVPCFAANDTLPELYTGEDTWNKIDVLDLMQTMRSAYESWRTFPELFAKEQAKAKASVAQFSYEVVGRNFKEALCHQ